NGSALTLDGTTGYAESGPPAVDTTQSFTVSAWAKPDQTKIGDLVAQLGSYQGGFYLGMEPDGHAVLKWPTTDTNDGGGVWQTATDDVPLPLGQWSHLIGVYDKTAAQTRLYVNGELQATRSSVTPLESHGPLHIGRSQYNGFVVNNWPGAIDDVRVFDQALSGTQAQQLAGGTVPAGAGLVADWNMEEPAGKPVVYSPVAPSKATLHNGAALGVPGQANTALQLDGSAGYAATGAPVVDTSKSFAVSVWAKVDASAPGTDFTALSMEGVHESAFYLKYVKDTQKWVFGRTATDTADAPGWYQASSKEPAQSGAWTHLVGVWDALSGRMRLYVNGDRGNDSPVTPAMWRAVGGLQIGRAKYKGVQVDHWPGLLDDVRVYDRIVGDREAEVLVTQHPVLKARWILNEDGSGEAKSGAAPALTLHNGAFIDPAAGFKEWGSTAGLKLSPLQKAFAETSSPVVVTDESFTIAGWVRNAGRPSQPATVFSQPGANTNAFALRYVPGEDPEEQGVWQVAMHNSDDAGATPLTASHAGFNAQNWSHLAVVYDALRDRVSLYVDGHLEQIAGNVSQAKGVVAFEAKGNGGLQVGRTKFGDPNGNGSEYWTDAVDDVWAYQGALTVDQIQMLASGLELPTKDGP
ncbi:LamG domain-containing protein, partial [Actinomadura geliboluensis]